ncbi:MAG: negative regulator of sigma E activity [Gammaproteobacteria bacterium]|jgi:negative regulator of sigma E activity
MNDHNEKLSNLLDEFSSSDIDRQLLGDALDDVNQQYCLNRYQMIGHVMRHELPDKIDPGFSHSVMASIRQIESEQKLAGKSFNAKQEAKFTWRWQLLKPFAGMAVAASVAVVSITLWQSVSVTGDSQSVEDQVVNADQQKIQQLASQPVQAAVNASAALDDGMHWKVISDAPALERKLNGYLVNHTEYSRSMQGLISQARVAGYGSQK